MPDRHPDGQIRVEQRGHLLLMGIDRPEKRNGFTHKMFQELAEAHTRLENTHELRCGVLYAEGDHFTAGIDLARVAAARKKGKSLLPHNQIDPFAMREPVLTKPMVIALKGYCYTIAVELMLAADVAVAADNCRFSQLEVKRGIIAGLGAIHRMVACAGWGNAMRYLLTGDEFGAEEACRMNMVQEVVPAGQELQRAIDIAERIAAQAPLAVQATKVNGQTFVNHGWLAAASRMTAVQESLFNTADAREGVQSFVEKRPARFTGH